MVFLFSAILWIVLLPFSSALAESAATDRLGGFVGYPVASENYIYRSFRDSYFEKRSEAKFATMIRYQWNTEKGLTDFDHFYIGLSSRFYTFSVNNPYQQGTLSLSQKTFDVGSFFGIVFFKHSPLKVFSDALFRIDVINDVDVKSKAGRARYTVNDFGGLDTFLGDRIGGGLSVGIEYEIHSNWLIKTMLFKQISAAPRPEKIKGNSKLFDFFSTTAFLGAEYAL